jgi:putative transposase
MARSHRYPSDLTDAQWKEIEPELPPPSKDGRNEKYPRREIVNAIVYVAHNGCVWRALPSDFPPCWTVYSYFKKWRDDGTTAKINNSLRRKIRIQEGRDPEPSAAVIDSQSVKAASTVGRDSRGWDEGKKVNGRKRFIAVDTLGMLLVVLVRAASAHDSHGGRPLLVDLYFKYPRTRHVFSDSGFAGKFAEWAKDVLNTTVEVVRKAPGQKGFKVLPKRWVVERTLAWIMACRRLCRDYERRTDSSESFIQWAMIRTMSRRIAHYGEAAAEGDLPSEGDRPLQSASAA